MKTVITYINRKNKKKYDAGGAIPYAQLGNTAGGFLDSYITEDDGTKNIYGATASGALKGAGTGAAIGSIIPGVGTAIGAGVGALAGGAISYFNTKKSNEGIDKALKERMMREQEMKKRIKTNYDLSQLEADPVGGNEDVNFYGKMGGIMIKPENRGKFTAYANAHGEGIQEAASKILANKEDYSSTLVKRANFAKNAASWHKYGGVMKYLNGGKMIELSSNVDKAVGNTHEQGGIQYGNAEIEDAEIVKDNNKVFSDTLEYEPSTTYATKAEEIGKKKGKYEDIKDRLGSNIYAKNTAKRMIEKLDGELNNLFNNQETYKNIKGIENNSNKAEYGDYLDPIGAKPIDYNLAPLDIKLPSQTTQSPQIFSSTGGGQSGINYGNILNGVGTVIPYIANFANRKLINETPQIPYPELQTPAQLKTKYSIDAPLATINSNIAAFNQGVDNNTTNSSVARANKLAATVAGIGRKNELYGNKENIETDLKNRNLLNTQTVNANNLAKIDNYNEGVAQRSESMRVEKSRANANLADVASNQVREYNQRQLDNKKIQLSLAIHSNNDAAAYRLYNDYKKAAGNDKNALRALRDILLQSKSGKQLIQNDKDLRNLD